MNSPDWSTLAGRRVLVDCRWLGRGGAGRLTGVLLRELFERPPTGEWVLWGDPERLRAVPWPGAVIRPASGDPRRLFGQRDAARVPPHDVALYLHGIRPLAPGRSVTFVHDTIPLRWGGPPAVRLAKRAFLRAVVRLSTRILTGSETSRAAIVRDLGIAPDRVDVVPYPLDERLVEAVAWARATVARDDVLLYVGRFDRHKNLPRLCDAFARTAFARAGGRLVLLGGWPGEVEPLRAWVARRGLRSVQVRAACPEGELVRALATCRALVMPSLEEGYGLPAFEAAAAGIPIAASRAGAMGELPEGVGIHFDATDASAMAVALDRAVERDGRRWQPPRGDFASAVVRALSAAAVTRRRPA